MITVSGLSKSYGKTLAVDDLSFEVETGVITGFLGPNGSGKSTTMRIIMGLDFPQRGTATINGQSFHDLKWPLREVGALLEAKAIHPGRSARTHLLTLARSNGIPRRRVDEVLDMESALCCLACNPPRVPESREMTQMMLYRALIDTEGVAAAVGPLALELADRPCGGAVGRHLKLIQTVLQPPDLS